MSEVNKIPSNLDAEKSVLGAILQFPDALMNVSDFLKVEHFYDEIHADVYSVCLELFNDGVLIDILTVIKRGQRLKKKLTPHDVSGLTGNVTSDANIVVWGRMIHGESIRREQMMLGNELMRKASDDSQDIFETNDYLLSRLDELTNVSETKRMKTSVELIQEVTYDIERAKDKDGITGVPSGHFQIDKIFGGWQEDNLIILAARPSQGKTALAIKWACNASDHKIHTLFFSLEMSDKQLTKRNLSRATGYSSDDMLKYNRIDWEVWNSRMGGAINEYLHIDDTPSISCGYLRARAKKMKIKHGLGLIVVDYLQLMTGEKKGNREQEISSISRALKAISKELGVPVIALSQLSRSVEDTSSKRPTLRHLRESGAIEQDADIVQFLFRPEYYGDDTTSDGESTAGKAIISIAKNIDGALGDVVLRFIDTVADFVDWEDEFRHFTGEVDNYIEPNSDF